MNSNVGYFNNENGGVGIIIRGLERQILMFATKWFSMLNNPLEGAVLAIIFGLQLLGEALFINLEVESDNLQFILCL